MSSNFEIEFNESVFCTELTTGKKHSGNFLFDGDGITTTLVSFDGHFFVKPDDPVFLLTEKLAVISLYDSFSPPTGRRSRYVEPTRTAHIQKIASNAAIVGDDEWHVADRVKRVSFGIRNSMALLRNHDKVARLSMNRSPIEEEKDAWLLLNFRTNGMIVRLYYTAKYDMLSDEPKEIDPRFELEFDKPVSFGDHKDSINQVVSFCSMALGVPLRPTEIRISRQSLESFLDDVENNRPTGDHRVLHRWSDLKIAPDEINTFGSPVNAREKDGLENLGECLRVWLERGPTWHDAYALMMDAFARRNEFGSERLLNACSWFETLPNSSPKVAFDTEALKKISDAAIGAAKGLGMAGLENRISGSLRSIGLENRDQLFRRLIPYAWQTYRLPHGFEDMVSDLKGSQKLRGKAAHGNLTSKDAASAERIIKHTDALEALCLLLTVRDLPLTADGRKRLYHHRTIEGYRQSN